MRDLLNGSLFFGSLISLAFYALGLAVKRRFRLAVFNPLLIATLCVIGTLIALDVDFAAYQHSTEVISYFLAPATVCLAVPLYEQLALLKRHWKAMLAGLLAGVLCGLGCVFALSSLFSFPHELYASLLPKNITSAIGYGLSQELGGVVPITASAIMIAGMFGGVAGEGLLAFFGVTDPVARGFGIGMASHAIGTARAMDLGQVEGAMSSLAIIAAGLTTVVAAPFFSTLL